MDIYARTPINKQSSIITSQDGCEETIYLELKEQLKVLGKRKAELGLRAKSLKEKLGYVHNRKSLGKNKKYPQHVLNNPIFKRYERTREELQKLDVEINSLKSKIEFNKPPESFERRFISKVRDSYPKIYEEIKSELLKNH